MKIWTVGTTWYLFLPTYTEKKLVIKRETFYKYLKDLCDEKGITRAQAGIITGARAELYFDGEWKSVSLDNIGELAGQGTETLFVEKQGVPELFRQWADKHGIAMVNTRGKLTEYGKDLMNAITRAGGHAVIMADYDATGVKIASESPTEMPWIGANDKMLAYFNLDRNSVKIESETSANKEYVKRLVESGKHDDGRIDNRFKDVDLDFLDNERIELDAILAKVGDERFFQYILDTLKKLYPKRDYNRAIQVPAKDFGAKHEDTISLIDARVKDVISPDSDKIKKGLSDVKGFMDVNEELVKIKKRLSKALAKNPDYEDFVIKLGELVKSHPFFISNKGERPERGNVGSGDESQ